MRLCPLSIWFWVWWLLRGYAGGVAWARVNRPPGSTGTTEIRILFVFDPARNAVLLVAGDKAGQWTARYRQVIPLAEARYATYLKEKEES